MPPWCITAALALVGIVLAFSSVAAKVCVLGTEPDPADGGMIKLVLPAFDPCTCTEVLLGGHNPYAPPGPGGEHYIDILHLKDILANGPRPLFHCTEASKPEATTDTDKTTDKVTLHAQMSTDKVALGTTPAAPTPVDTTQVLSSTSEPTEPPADCQDILDAGQTTSGVYTIQHEGQNMTVYCRMESGNGYIVFQRRLDGSVSFDRTWQEYAVGFGNLTGEFWLGNQKLHNWAGNWGWELVITLRVFNGDEARVRYGYFRIRSYDYKYKLYASGFIDEIEDAGNSLLYHYDEEFSTRDADNDNDGKNCAETYRGGWWYWDCDHSSNFHSFQSNLNGLYSDNAAISEPMQGLQWSTWKGKHVCLKGCEMMIRRSSPLPADCQDILDAGETTSGVYTIQNSDQKMTVYCRMESEKGYIVFQRRQDGSVSFDRTRQEYTEGFGNLTGEFWLGNQKLSFLADNGRWELVITLSAFDGGNARVRYEKFWTFPYELDFSNFVDESGNAGDLLGYQQTDFSTRDDDNDSDWKNCADKFHGGWWYRNCGSSSTGFQSNLNGLYYNNAAVPEPMQGIQWSTWKGNQVSLKGCEMMIRRRP